MTKIEPTPSVRVIPTSVVRSIKSFVKREGRMTAGQKKALQLLWPRFGIDLNNESIQLDKVFSQPGPVVLEIGFGMGESIAAMAQQNSAENYLGIEVHRPGVGRLLSYADKLNLQNIAVICHDAVDVLTHHLDGNSLQRVQIFFPDPWHKKKHHKRRLIQADFISLLANKISNHGLLHIATDWQHYAEHIVDALHTHPAFENVAGNDNYVSRPTNRPLTRFEQRGERLGHGVWDMVFRKVN